MSSRSLPLPHLLKFDKPNLSTEEFVSSMPCHNYSTSFGEYDHFSPTFSRASLRTPKHLQSEAKITPQKVGESPPRNQKFHGKKMSNITQTSLSREPTAVQSLTVQVSQSPTKVKEVDKFINSPDSRRTFSNLFHSSRRDCSVFPDDEDIPDDKRGAEFFFIREQNKETSFAASSYSQERSTRRSNFGAPGFG